jgi:hypothetical protein
MKAEQTMFELGSALFYFRNCPMAAKGMLRATLHGKIRHILEGPSFR